MKINISLSEQSISKAIEELHKYRKSLENKAFELREKIAQLISNHAQTGFDSSIVDDLLDGNARKANVSVSVDTRENVTIIIAKGEDAIWVEFGAGVYHNGAIGSSPHPKGAELGFKIGTYGKGKGKQKIWSFKEDGELKLTHGTPATMPMYKAVAEISNQVHMIAKEVFR